MADNVTFQTTTATPPSGTVVSTEEVSTLNGGAVTAQQVQRVIPAIRTGDGTAVDIPGDSSNGIDVDVTRVSGTVEISAASLPLPSGAATAANQTTEIASLASIDGKITTVNTGAVVVSSSALPSGAATSANQTSQSTLIGAVDETAPATDTASSGLNGRLQRIAQRLTSLIALLPTSLGQKTKANSLAVTLASDQDALPVTDNNSSLTVDGTVAATQSGAWNITDISGTVSLPTGAATAARQDTQTTALQLIDDIIKTDDAAFTPATDKVAMVGAEFDDGSPDSVDEGDAGALRMSANRNLYVQIRDAAGNERGLNVDASGNIGVTDAGGALTVDNGGTFAVQVSSIAAGTNNIGDVDIASIAAGDNNIGNVDIASIAAGDNNIGNVDVVTMPGVVGTVADDGTTPGSPVMIGGKAVETDGTDPTSVSAEDDVAIFRTDRNRRLLVNTAHPNQWVARENHTTAGTNNELKAAPGENLSLYITDIIMSTDVATNIKLVEDTAGTPVDKAGPFYFAANGGISAHLVTPIRVTANTNLGFTGGTTGNFTVEIHGYTAP